MKQQQNLTIFVGHNGELWLGIGNNSKQTWKIPIFSQLRQFNPNAPDYSKESDEKITPKHLP